MRALSSLIILFISIYTCKAQEYNDHCLDSLHLCFREKAEHVLSHCVDMDHEIMLYATGNQYYIITHNNDSYQEYYVAVDSLNSVIDIFDNSHNAEIEMLEAKKFLSLKNRKYLSRLQSDKNIVLDAFDTTQYSEELISPEPVTLPIFCDISPSYFIIKDRNNVIVERFSVSNPLPYPVNMDLSIYLLRELALCRTLSEHKNKSNSLE